MTQLRYYDEADIQKIADSTRALIGTDSRLTVTEIGDYLQNKELANRNIKVAGDNIYIKYYHDISEYRNGVITNGSLTTDHTKYPILSYEDGSNYQNYVFCGWFTTSLCETAIDQTRISGEAYAKFVDLHHSKMTNDYTINADGTASIRWFWPVVDTEVNLTGFNLLNTANNKEIPVTVDNMYSNLLTEKTNGKYHLSYAAFNEHALGVAAWSLSGIPSGNFNTYLNATHRVRTLDGTIVLGYRNFICVNDMINNIKHVPVVLNSETPLTYISFDVIFNHNRFNYNKYNLENLKNFSTVSVDTSDCSKGILHITAQNSNSLNCRGTLIDLCFVPIIEETAVAPVNTFKLVNQKYYNGTNEIFMNIPDCSYLQPQGYYIGPLEESTSTFRMVKRSTSDTTSLDNIKLVSRIEMEDLPKNSFEDLFNH